MPGMPSGENQSRDNQACGRNRIPRRWSSSCSSPTHSSIHVSSNRTPRSRIRRSRSCSRGQVAQAWCRGRRDVIRLLGARAGGGCKGESSGHRTTRGVMHRVPRCVAAPARFARGGGAAARHVQRPAARSNAPPHAIPVQATHGGPAASPSGGRASEGHLGRTARPRETDDRSVDHDRAHRGGTAPQGTRGRSQGRPWPGRRWNSAGPAGIARGRNDHGSLA
jgi:hypothetical protein